MEKYLKSFGNDLVVDRLIAECADCLHVRAYPNYQDFISIPGANDTQKWLQATKEIYYEEKNGLHRADTIRKITGNWSVPEVYDFLHWLKYYEEGTHLKYKVAQFFYGNPNVGYMLPIKPDAANEGPSVQGKDIDFAKDNAVESMPVAEKKRIIERQRSKIIGRLDSAEKLLRSEEGDLFADKEVASLLQIIYDLKMKIQMVNKKSSSTKLYEDMIVRGGNVLVSQGFGNAAQVLYRLAQDTPMTPETPPSSGSPVEPGGSPGLVPMPNMGGNGIPTGNNNSVIPKSGLDIFLENLNPAVIDELNDDDKADDDEVDDNDDDNDLDDDLLVEDHDEDIIVNAQMDPAPPPAPVATKPAPSPGKETVQVDKLKEPAPTTPTKDFDGMLSAVFSNLTMEDVIAKFEDIAKYYKTREMPRQLAMADMMLDSLGLAAFFPSLSEATNKSLEANNYISSRLEEILAKLRASIKTVETEPAEKKSSPEMDKAKQVLKDQEDKDISKKQMRKDLEDQAMEEKMKDTPDIEVSEDLEAPIESAAPAAAPPASPVPPVVPAAKPAPKA